MWHGRDYVCGLNGYEIRHQRLQLGFRFDDRLKQWSCVLLRDQAEQIGQVEALLEQTGQTPSPPAVDPQHGQPSRCVTPELLPIDAVLKEASWLRVDHGGAIASVS